jgi:hypothetical protein
LKKFSVVFLAFVMVLGLITPLAKANNSFKDVPAMYSFFEEIMYLSGRDVINGYNDGTFKPNQEVSRAAAAAMIGRAIGLDGEKKATTFKDVGVSSFASGYIDSAVEEGIIKGFTDGTFRPNEIVTRGQMAIFLARAFELEDVGDTYFKDITSQMAAYSPILQILQAGITDGYNDGTFRPNLDVTRSQFSAFLARALNPEFRLDTEEPNTEEPNTEEPNTEEPNTEEPNTEEPNTEEHGSNGIELDVDISGVYELEQYLNDEYSVLYTPAGMWDLTHEITKNNNILFFEDYWIKTDWNPVTGLSPYDLTYSISISESDRIETQELLTQLQKEVAYLSMKALPEKKIRGGYYSGFYKYPHLNVGYESISFISWNNYSIPDDFNANYYDSMIDGFKWNSKYDDYSDLTIDNQKSVSIPEWNKLHIDNVQQEEGWNKNASETYVQDWILLNKDKKIKLIQSVIDKWKNNGDISTKDAEWFLNKLNEFYNENPTALLDVETNMEIFAEVNLVFG